MATKMTPAPTTTNLLTAQEVANILRLNKPDKVYLLVRSGLLSGFKFGKRWLISEDSVYRYIDKMLSV